MTEESIFAAAMDKKTPAERAAFLDGACAGNADLRRRVEALLQAHEQAGSFLEPPALTGPFVASRERERPQEGEYPPVAYAPGSPAMEAVGSQIGPYKLLQKLGEGGMGTVWVAEQQQPVKRRVALKVIKAGMDSVQILRRFEAERQALALMDHTNIAKVLDAGTTDAGRPYFAMELVQGVPMRRYCDELHLTIRERLELFVPVCQAIQHAHQKGIIHRDIKPSNVLVCMQDGKPVAKVIDFGVAKALNQPLSERTMYTEIGAVIGTLEYMAPEQAEMSPLGVDTRSDVYSLGVLLYELLTGSTPLSRERLRTAALTEMVRIIREEEPPKPSTRLSESQESLSTLATQRRTEPARLTKEVRGELDWIVMKCLEKDRTRRYETANGLARDIERHLHDEAVEACPPSAGYRMRKFVRRHKGQVIAASLIALALIGGIVGTSLGLVEAQRSAEAERQAKVEAQAAAAAEKAAKLEAEARRQEAERNLAFAKKGNEILGSVFAGLDPKQIAESGRPLQDMLRENLTKAVKELEGSAIGEPLEVVAMQNTLGQSLLGLGEASLAVEVYQKALATREAKLGPDNPYTLASMNQLALAYFANGQLAKAVPLYEESLAKLKARLGPDHPDTLNSMNNLAEAYRSSRQPAKAVPLFEEALETGRAKLGPDHPFTLTCMNGLAAAYRANRQPAKAVPLLEEAVGKQKAKLGPDHPSTLISMNNLALAYQDSGQIAKAVPLCEEALQRQTAKLGPDHPDTLTGMNNLAGAYAVSGQLDKALPLFEQSFHKHNAKLGPDHPDTLLSMNNLATAYLNSGQSAKAVPLFEETLEKRKAKLGPDHPDTLRSMNNLATAYLNSGQPAKAVPLLEQVLQKHIAKLGAEDPQTLETMASLGLVLLQQKKWAEAEPVLRGCLVARQKTQPDDWRTFNTQSMLGGALLGKAESVPDGKEKTKLYAQAEPLLLAGYEGMKLRADHIPPQGKARLPESLEWLVKLYAATGREEAAAMARKELESVKAAIKP